jgi:hypothetical protein
MLCCKHPLRNTNAMATSRPCSPKLFHSCRCLDTIGASVLCPGDSRFAAEAAPLNARIRRQPLAVVFARSVSDVQAAVKCGLAHGVRIVPRSGGHSYEGAPACLPSRSNTSYVRISSLHTNTSLGKTVNTSDTVA